MRFDTNDTGIWRMACEMCASDACFWSDQDGLSLHLCLNDVFVAAADSEAVQPADVAKVYAAWKKDDAALIAWAKEKRCLEFTPA